MRASELAPADRELMEAALDAQRRSYAPISRYYVGAALRTESGAVVQGCNVENILLSLSLCAEAVTVYKAISDGHQAFREIAVVTNSTPAASPCGSCRQLLSYWEVRRILVGNPEGDVEILDIADLLPRAFALREPVPPEADPRRR